jgi:sarcosine oxidase
MADERRELAVVGAGLLGLSAGRALAAAGRDVVVLEQAAVGHERSGSRGPSRIFRLGYEDPTYVRMARLALGLWRELEAEAGRTLLTVTGQLDLGVGRAEVRAAMQAAGAPVEELGAGAVGERWPGVAWSGAALWEPDSGVLSADACLGALRACSAAELREGSRVTGIRDSGRTMELSVAGPDGVTRTLACDIVVICAGAWSRSLTAAAGIPLLLRPTLEQVAYFRAGDHCDPLGLPIFIERRPREEGASPYGLPTFSPGPSGGTYKVAFHGGGQEAADPDEVGLAPDPVVDRALGAVVGRLLPGLDPRPVGSERCFYDNSPDEGFVIDRVGRVVIGAGTSGHGFKFGPLWGVLLAALALGTVPPVPLDSFVVGTRFRGS